MSPWQRLYVRIWLAVVLAVAVLTLLTGWVWRLAAEPPLREVHIRDSAGAIIGSGQSRSLRPGVPGLGLPPPSVGLPMSQPPERGPEFIVQMNNGQTVHVHLPRSREPSFPGGRSYRFFWLLGLVGLAVALATYPIVRQLTRRLEVLQGGVERWGTGDLSVRVPVQGSDEVADLARRFNSAAERIQALLAAHRSLLANASHELRSPLARIRMGLELIGDQPSHAFRAEIARNISELDQLIDEILLASRLDAQGIDAGMMETIDLTGLVAEECAHAQADFSADGSTSQPIYVQGVVKQLRRVVRNLLDNAGRYSHGSIAVTLDRTADWAQLCVSDHGPGIPLDRREQIFEPFYRLPGTSDESGGVGLGLALVKTIAVCHGGSVRCEDRVGGGACFVVALPLEKMTA
ncbi:MAG: hypothetical protein RLZZ401_1483 [Pseudomonadota bacterium]